MLAFVVVLTVLVMPSAVGAQQELSEICAYLRDYPPTRFTGVEFSEDFFAGETVSMTVDNPGLGNPQTVTLEVNDIVVDSTPFPGTVSYTIPSDGTYKFFARIDEGTNAIIDFDCTNEPPPPSTPTCNGLAATVYVKDGKIVGGPNDGQPYQGELLGTSGNDVMVGTSGRDAMNGRVGNDTICALEGNDRIEGAGGNDTLYGGLGADRFKGGAGADSAPDFNALEGDSQEQVEQLS
jgi:Ca2+-binding RTX toxin-like protein